METIDRHNRESIGHQSLGWDSRGPVMRRLLFDLGEKRDLSDGIWI